MYGKQFCWVGWDKFFYLFQVGCEEKWPCFVWVGGETLLILVWCGFGRRMTILQVGKRNDHVWVGGEKLWALVMCGMGRGMTFFVWIGKRNASPCFCMFGCKVYKKKQLTIQHFVFLLTVTQRQWCVWGVLELWRGVWLSWRSRNQHNHPSMAWSRMLSLRYR